MNIDDLKNLIKNGSFKNPTKGEMSLKEVMGEIMNYVNEGPEFQHKIFIGTDSEKRENSVDFVSVVVVHRIGNGGRYFWLRSYDGQPLEFRNRIYKEAILSLALAQALLEQELENNHISVAAGKSIIEAIRELRENPVSNLSRNIILANDLEIHVDIGTVGPTRDMIKEIVGMILGSGFDVKIKPEAFAAANVADKHL